MQIKTIIKLLACVSVVSGCTYNAKIQESSLSVSAAYGQRAPKAITLIDNRDALLVSTFKVGGYTGNVDAREAFFNATKSMLGTVYNKVDVSTSPKNENPLYAVASYDTKLPDPGPVTTLIANEVRLEMYDSETKRLINTYIAKNEGRAGVNFGLGFLTGFTLFVLSPITVPLITNGFGSEGEQAIENNLKSGLATIKAKIATNP